MEVCGVDVVVMVVDVEVVAIPFVVSVDVVVAGDLVVCSVVDDAGANGSIRKKV
ncbi:hypothetical protein DPMN_075087 [Dreissena polymorpha]|uniref:Uncharacterized protein n=1 Tax=Dreissena polymorpha TaxID=45954 RepID=A0A9D3YJU8_DREPO|nr:hypothetical protein DPMN_075087 [Dreissena polymorpha]